MLFLVLAVSCAVWWVAWRIRHRRILAMAARLPGPPALPLLGNALTFSVPAEAWRPVLPTLKNITRSDDFIDTVSQVCFIPVPPVVNSGDVVTDNPVDEPIAQAPAPALSISDTKQIFNFLGQMKQTYGRKFKFWLGPELNSCIAEPEDVKILLQSSKTSCRGPQYKYMIDFLGYGILSGSGPVWRKRRKLISPNYSNKVIETYSHVFNGETRFLIERLRTRSAESFNIYEEVVKTTSYSVCQTLFGLTRDQSLGLPHLQEIINETHQTYADVFMRMVKWYLQIKPYYWLTRQYPKHKHFIQKTLKMSETIVKHRAKKLEAAGLTNIDDCNNLNGSNTSLSTVDKLLLTNSISSYEELLKQIYTIFTTSQETSANIGSFLLLMIAYHPECQEKLYAEIKNVFGDDRDVTNEDLRRMPYLDMVFKETMRLFPIAPMIQRTVLEDIDISNGITLPAGSSLLVPIFHIHRDKEFWQEPDVFDPERFTPERCAARHPDCYIPFSLGAMDCLGRYFGTRLIKTITIGVLREFRLTSPESYADLRLFCAVSVEAVNGYPVFLHQRNS